MDTNAPETIDRRRRQVIGAAAISLAAVELGINVTARAAAPQAAQNPFGSLKQISAGVLNVGYAELEPADGAPVVLLHGWPYDIHTYVDVAPLLASKGYRVIVPYLRGLRHHALPVSDETMRNGQQSAIAADIVR